MSPKVNRSQALGLGFFAAPLELAGLIRTGSAARYVLLQAAIGAVQFVIAAALLRGYRQAGP